MLLFEVREDEIEDPNDIIDEVYIPQQSALSNQSNNRDCSTQGNRGIVGNYLVFL